MADVGTPGVGTPARIALGQVRALARLLLGGPAEAGADWPALADLALRHRLAPLLYFQLNRGCAGDGVPEEILQDLQNDYYVALARAVQVEQQLGRALAALAAAGVPAIVVKGPAFAAAYPDPALRPFGDLDIWVRPASLDRAEAALEALGYRCMTPRPEVLVHHHIPPMLPDEGGVTLDVHWRLDGEGRVGRLPEEALWARAVGWSVAGQATLRLEAVDAVLHLCRHAVVQNLLQGGLRSLLDLAFLTRGWDRGQWRALAQRAVEYGLGRAVYLMLYLQEEALGLAAPCDALEALRPAGSEAVPPSLVERAVGLNGRGVPHIPSTASRAWARGGLAARLGYALRQVFLPPEGMAALASVEAGSPRAWLLYLTWPVTLLRRYGPALWQVVRGGPGARAAWQRDVWLQQWLREEQAGEGRAS